MPGISGAWARTGPLLPVLTPLTRHLLDGRKAVLFEASVDGHAAVLYEQGFHGITVDVANPRLNTLNRPDAKMGLNAKVCHDVLGTGAMKRMRAEDATEDPCSIYRGWLPFDLVLMQDQEEVGFLEGQAKPFLTVHGKGPRLTYVQLQNGPGHVVAPRRVLLDALRSAGSRLQL